MRKFFTLLIVSAIYLTFSGSVFADLKSGLVAYYPFNGNANDESGNGNNGTVYGGAALVQDKFGNVDKAYHFDGIDDYIEFENSITLDPANTNIISVAVWVKFDSLNKGQPILGKWPLSYLLFKQDISNKLIWIVNNDPNIQINYSKPIEINKWYHVVGVADSLSAKLYVDGILIGTSISGVSSINTTYPTKLRIGYEETEPSYFNGTIDEVFIYNRALSAAEIKEIYYQGNPPTIKGNAPWGTPHIVTCKNITQNVTVTIPKTKAAHWDCEKAGLPAQSGDKVKVTIDGTKY